MIHHNNYDIERRRRRITSGLSISSKAFRATDIKPNQKTQFNTQCLEISLYVVCIWNNNNISYLKLSFIAYCIRNMKTNLLKDEYSRNWQQIY